MEPAFVFFFIKHCYYAIQPIVDATHELLNDLKQLSSQPDFVCEKIFITWCKPEQEVKNLLFELIFMGSQTLLTISQSTFDYCELRFLEVNQRNSFVVLNTGPHYSLRYPQGTESVKS